MRPNSRIKVKFEFVLFIFKMCSLYTEELDRDGVNMAADARQNFRAIQKTRADLLKGGALNGGMTCYQVLLKLVC